MKLPAKLTLSILTLFSSFSVAMTGVPSYFCASENPKGALYLQLDETGKKSLGRQSTPFTSNLEILKEANPNPREYTKLNVGNVKLERLDSGRPFCSDCYSFNVSPYGLSKDAEVLRKTISTVSKVAGNRPGEVLIMLKLYVEHNFTLKMICEKLK